MNRASRQPNRRPSHTPNQSTSNSSSDLFTFVDDEANPPDPRDSKPASDAPSASVGAPRRGRTKRRGPPSRTRSDRKDVTGAYRQIDSDQGFEEIGGNIEDAGAVEADVDDGFYARYRKENDGDGRVANFSGYEALDADAEELSEGGKEGKGRMGARKMDRQMAENAFDAVDRLFENIASKGEGVRKGVRPKDRRGSKHMNREKWLADVKARAATRGGDRDDRGVVVDVNATEEWDGLGEAGEPVNERNDGKMGGDKARGSRVNDEMDNAEWERNEWGAEGADSSGRKRQRNVSFTSEAMFQNLIKIARRGPGQGSGAKRRDPMPAARNIRQNRTWGGSGSGWEDTQGKGQNSRADRFVREDRTAPVNPRVSRLLGITKQITDDERTEPLENRGMDGAEDDLAVQSARADVQPRFQRFSTVRRVGGRAHRIYKAPEEWQPLSDIEIARVRSDSRPLTRGMSRGKGVVAACRACRGTGLEPCIACQGKGWIPPLKDNSVKGKRREILEKMWMSPNLVVDKSGEAQCFRCNGIGKQFCPKCKGSGSATKKGFSYADMRDVFDIFLDGDESYPEDELVGDEYTDSEEEEVEEDVDEFQLYKGGAETEDGDENDSSKKYDGEDNGIESHVEVVDEDMDVEDESAELLAALKAMHLADLEESNDDSEDDLIGGRISTGRDSDDMVESVIEDDMDDDGVAMDDEDDSDVLENVDDEIDVEEEDDDFQIFLEDGEDEEDEDEDDDDSSGGGPDEDPFSDEVVDDSRTEQFLGSDIMSDLTYTNRHEEGE